MKGQLAKTDEPDVPSAVALIATFASLKMLDQWARKSAIIEVELVGSTVMQPLFRGGVGKGKTMDASMAHGGLNETNRCHSF